MLLLSSLRHGQKTSLVTDWAVCAMIRAASTCLGSLRPFALIMASRDSIVLRIAPSRMALLKEPIVLKSELRRALESQRTKGTAVRGLRLY